MKFEFPFQGLYEQIENVVSKIYFPLNVSLNAKNVTLKVISHYSCQVIQLYLSMALIYGLTYLFPYFTCNDDGKN